VRELRQGLWHWQPPHPDWGPSEPWDQNVSSYAIDDDERLVLFDPLGVPDDAARLIAWLCACTDDAGGSPAR
jgi:hypothetical protein